MSYRANSKHLLRPRLLVMLLLLPALPLLAESKPGAVPATSCTNCHSDTTIFDAEAARMVHAFGRDVHARVGLSCHHCHGGNPDLSVSDDMDAAMDPSFSASPYKGVPSRAQVPEFCAECHASPSYMRRYKPDARVDQLSEYWTSGHGERLRAGDTNVATCIDCHGVHGIVPAGDIASPVYPTRIAETCAKCHSDQTKMASYTTPAGAPLPTDQFERWRMSVHARALLEKNDLSAPTCNDCHGNHGAAPPGVQSVTFVCGQCHGRETDLFRGSPKLASFAEHNEFVGSGTCADCHEAMPARAAVGGFSECTTCHDNHAIVRPSISMLGAVPTTPCSLCHEPIDRSVVKARRSDERYRALRDALLAEAKEEKVSDERLFDWMLAKALQLPTHTIDRGTDEAAGLRPEFARLVDKFRLGDPSAPHVSRSCIDCHAESDSNGARVAGQLVAKMHELTALTAEADRLLLRAQRGGVEVRKVREELEGAVDAQIELEALVHTFDPEGEFGKKHAEGVAHARAALTAGDDALAELTYRRKGLGVALGFVVLFLFGLGWKIHDLSREE